MYLIIHNVHIAAILDLFKTHISWRFCLKLVGKKKFVILSVSGSVLQHLSLQQIQPKCRITPVIIKNHPSICILINMYPSTYEFKSGYNMNS